jgi:oxygen-independent coproporphyrinogen-3 oxidase
VSILQFEHPLPLTLYVHFPWCVRKCPYCDFNSHEASGTVPESQYVDALLQDLDQELPLVWGRPLRSVFFGGGTPSLFSPAALQRLIDALRARFNFAPTTEITMEANPGTLEHTRFPDYRQAGINRVSIGVQSFNEAHLKRLGRIHSAGEAHQAVAAARDAGFDSFNVDLMYGLPGQDLQQARDDLATAIALAPPHLSYYQLTIEPNTWFAHHPPTLPDEDHIWTIQREGQALLQDHDYHQYEVSAYCRNGHGCAHNLNYWQFGDYLGIGAGAHGKLTDAANGRILRRWKLKHPKAYLQYAADPGRIAGEQTLKRADVILEFMMNGLRLRDGFETALFQAHTGMPLSVARAPLEQAQEQGWLEWDLHRIRPTSAGYRYLNDMLALFLPDN